MASSEPARPAGKAVSANDLGGALDKLRAILPKSKARAGSVSASNFKPGSTRSFRNNASTQNQRRALLPAEAVANCWISASTLSHSASALASR